MSDDEEPSVFHRDARDGLLTSAADKQRKALNHFNGNRNLHTHNGFV